MKRRFGGGSIDVCTIMMSKENDKRCDEKKLHKIVDGRSTLKATPNFFTYRKIKEWK